MTIVARWRNLPMRVRLAVPLGDDELFERRVYVYRPSAPVGVIEHPTELSGDPELPGLVLDLRSIW